MQRGNRIGLAAMLVCVFTPGLFASTVFNLEDFPLGTGTPFTDTVAGLQASFSSFDDPGGFEVDSSLGLFKTLTGNILFPLGIGSYLSIDFSAPQTSISIPFSTTEDPEGTPLPIGLTAFYSNGITIGTAVGTASATGVVYPGFTFPEGILSFSGPAFDEVIIGRSVPFSFLIGNVTVSAVPEPSSLSLVAFGGFVGFCVSAITRLRRRGA